MPQTDAITFLGFNAGVPNLFTISYHLGTQHCQHVPLLEQRGQNTFDLPAFYKNVTTQITDHFQWNDI